MLPAVREVYEALVLGTAPRLRAARTVSPTCTSVSRVGSTSRLWRRIAVDALGAEHVTGVDDAVAVLERSQHHRRRGRRRQSRDRALLVPIEPAHQAFEAMLADVLASAPAGLAEENVQSRIRGNVLMTISNKLGSLVLTTGTERMATGYATLYGDMVGGFAVIKDVPKTLVYALCADRNEAAAGAN